MGEAKAQAAQGSGVSPVPKLGRMEALTAIAKSTVKRGIDVYFASKVKVLRAMGVVDFPVPPNSRLRRTSSHTIRHYYESGLTTMMPILTAARLYGVDLEQPVDVLDFGCGVGRQMLQLTRQYPHVHACACDAVPDNVQHIQRVFPQVDAYANSFDPPLKWASNVFDLVYSVSTFSHFSPDDARLWLTELRRVTKPGGILCLTINGTNSMRWEHRRGRVLEHTSEELMEQGSWFEVDEAGWQKAKAEEAISPFGSATIGATRPTGNMYFSPTFARQFFESTGLEIAGHAPGVIDRMQDLIVARKPNS